MKAIGVIEVDLTRNALGLPSRCLESLDDRSVLECAVARLRSAEGIDDVVVSVAPGDLPKVEPVLAKQSCRVEPRQHDDIAHREVLRRGRKWSLEGWRGGIGGMTYFDEQGIMAELARLADAHGADLVVTARAEAGLLDPRLVGDLVEFVGRQGEDVRFAFSTAPPGLGAEAYRRKVLEEFAAARQSPGFTLKYYPKEPRPDLIDGPCCMKIPVEIAASPFRYLADSVRGLDRLRRLYALRGEDGGALAVTRLMAEHPEIWSGPAPREVAIEITTQSNLDDRLLPPRDRIPARGPMTLATFSHIVEALGQASDDVLVTIGGFGQPLRHPDLLDMIHAARRAGIYGVTVVTDGIDLTGSLAEALVQADLDVLLVQLDAHTPETYKQLKGADRYEEVVAHIEAFIGLRREHTRPYPFIVPQFTKVREAMPEMSDFFDHWLSHTDWAVLRGHDDRAGQLPSLAVMNMAPARRGFCRRLLSRMTILSDGTVCPCESDFAGTTSLGDVAKESVVALWRDGPMAGLRRDHLSGRWAQWGLCENCCEWHRP